MAKAGLGAAFQTFGRRVSTQLPGLLTSLQERNARLQKEQSERNILSSAFAPTGQVPSKEPSQTGLDKRIEAIKTKIQEEETVLSETSSTIDNIQTGLRQQGITSPSKNVQNELGALLKKQTASQTKLNSLRTQEERLAKRGERKEETEFAATGRTVMQTLINDATDLIERSKNPKDGLTFLAKSKQFGQMNSKQRIFARETIEAMIRTENETRKSKAVDTTAKEGILRETRLQLSAAVNLLRSLEKGDISLFKIEEVEEAKRNWSLFSGNFGEKLGSLTVEKLTKDRDAKASIRLFANQLRKSLQTQSAALKIIPEAVFSRKTSVGGKKNVKLNKLLGKFTANNLTVSPEEEKRFEKLLRAGAPVQLIFDSFLEDKKKTGR